MRLEASVLELALEGINIDTMNVTRIQMEYMGDDKRARENARVTIKTWGTPGETY